MKKTTFVISLVLFIAVLVYIDGFSQLSQWINSRAPKKSAIQTASLPPENDSIEVVGTPTKDDPWLEMTKLVKTFSIEKGVHIKGEISVIDDNGKAEKVLERTAFEFQGIKDKTHCRLGDIEYIDKRNFAIVADHKLKVIGISEKKVQSSFKPFDIELFEKMILEKEGQARVTQTSDEKILTIDHIKNSDIQGYRIYYHPETYRINRILVGMLRFQPLEQSDDKSDESLQKDIELNEYHYYTEITYSEIQTLGLNYQQFNPEKRFFLKKKGRTQLMPAYQMYQLFDNAE